jgi:hypothetical protein
MKYEVKSFKDHNPQDGTSAFEDKDRKATEWLNQMAAQGYRLVAIASSPIYLSQPLSTTNIANSITFVVENTQILSP